MPETLDFEYESHTFAVTIDGEGKFWTEWNGDGIEAVSYDLLKKKVKAAYQPVQRCAIPAMKGRSPGDLDAVTIIGFHAGNRNFLYKYDDPEKDRDTQQAYRNSNEFFPVLTKAQIAEWARLEKAQEDARKAEARWQKKNRMADPVNLVRQALGMPVLPPEEKDRRYHTHSDDENDDE